MVTCAYVALAGRTLCPATCDIISLPYSCSARLLEWRRVQCRLSPTGTDRTALLMGPRQRQNRRKPVTQSYEAKALLSCKSAMLVGPPNGLPQGGFHARPSPGAHFALRVAPLCVRGVHGRCCADGYPPGQAVN